MSHLPSRLARRIDRVFRRAHGFHRFAHHPLCERYRSEVFRIGRRTRICRGCSLFALGLATGAVAGFFSTAFPAPLFLLLSILLLLAVPLVMPSEGRSSKERLRRPAAKIATRLLPGLVAGAVLAQGLFAPARMRLAATALTLAALLLATVRYRKRGPDRAACLPCPEGPPGTSCPGFSPIARRERALTRLAGRWIAEEVPGRPAEF